MKLYPVPAVDDVTIEWLGLVDNSLIQFWVTDMNGRLVDQFNLYSKSGSNYHKLDIRKLAPMTYVLNAELEGVLFKKKFIKK